jgi:hypothetical protein
MIKHMRFVAVAPHWLVLYMHDTCPPKQKCTAVARRNTEHGLQGCAVLQVRPACKELAAAEQRALLHYVTAAPLLCLINALILPAYQRMRLLTEVIDLLALLVHELSVLFCLLIVNMHQVQHQWPPGHNACTTGQEIPAHDCFKH